MHPVHRRSATKWRVLVAATVGCGGAAVSLALRLVSVSVRDVGHISPVPERVKTNIDPAFPLACKEIADVSDNQPVTVNSSRQI